MSLLGFDAIGRWALGQNPARGNAALIAAAGSFVIAGAPIAFGSKAVAAAGSYVITGNAATFAGKLAAAAGSYAITGFGASVSLRSGLATSAAALVVPSHLIRGQLRHQKFDTTSGYIKTAQLHQRNAAGMVGF